MVRIFSAFQFFFVITEHTELGSVKNNTLPIQYVAEMGRIVKYYYLHDMNLLVFFFIEKNSRKWKTASKHSPPIPSRLLFHYDMQFKFLLLDYHFILTVYHFSFLILFIIFSLI